MDVLIAERISAGARRGRSRPVVVETAAGARLVKLRGAAPGTGPLVAEIIVAELADAAGLSVPPRSLVELPAEIEAADWDDELADLLAASAGLNLGFDYLAGRGSSRRRTSSAWIRRRAPRSFGWIDWS